VTHKHWPNQAGDPPPFAPKPANEPVVKLLMRALADALATINRYGLGRPDNSDLIPIQSVLVAAINKATTVRSNLLKGYLPSYRSVDDIGNTTQDDCFKMTPGFTLTCSHCQSTRVMVNNDLCYSEASGQMGNVYLQCCECRSSVSIV
jgi:hypothetical protein